MSKVRLSHLADQTLGYIIKCKGGIIRPYRLRNKPCYRLLDAKFNPLYNLDYNSVTELINNGIIKITGEKFAIIKTK